MLLYIAIAIGIFIAVGIVTWVIGDDEVAGFFFLLAVIAGFIWVAGWVLDNRTNNDVPLEVNVTATQSEHVKAVDGMTSTQEDKYWYQLTYKKFVDKFNLSAEEFKQIDGETKNQLVKRIRDFMATSDAIPEEHKPKEQVVTTDPIPELKNVEEPEDPNFKFSKTW